MFKKKKKINPLSDWFSLVVAVFFIGFMVYSFFHLFHYERKGYKVQSILENTTIDKIKQKYDSN